MKHIDTHTRLSRDPDARPETVAYCGYSEELSWSGKRSQHTSFTNDVNSDDVCEYCKTEWKKEIEREKDIF